MVNHVWQRFFQFNNRIYKLFCMALTFTCVSVAWVFFRAENWGAAINILKGMAGLNGAELDYRLGKLLPFLSDFVNFQGTGIGAFPSVYGVVWLVIAGMICWFLPNIYQQLGTKPNEADGVGVFHGSLSRTGKFYRIFLMLIVSCMFVVAFSRIGALSEFLYFDF